MCPNNALIQAHPSFQGPLRRDTYPLLWCRPFRLLGIFVPVHSWVVHDASASQTPSIESSSPFWELVGHCRIGGDSLSLLVLVKKKLEKYWAGTLRCHQLFGSQRNFKQRYHGIFPTYYIWSRIANGTLI